VIAYKNISFWGSLRKKERKKEKGEKKKKECS